MNIPEEHWQDAPVALPPIHLPRGLVNRLELDTAGAEWASAKLAYVLEVGLQPTPPDTAAPPLAASVPSPMPSAFAILQSLAILLNEPDSVATVREASAALDTPFGTVALELARKMAAAGIGAR